VDFLLVLIKLFAKCYDWGATREYQFKIGGFAPKGPADPNFQVKRSPHQPFFLSENLAKWSFVWYKNLDRFFPFCHNARVWQTDRQNSHR